MSGRSSWTWVGPALVAAPIWCLTIQFGDGWPWWGRGVGWLWGLVFACWALVNLGQYIAEFIVDKWRDVLDLVYRTGPAGQAEALSHLSDRQLQVLARVAGGAWIMKLTGEAPGPQFLLGGAEEVPIEFLAFVLDNSDEFTLMPERRLNDQAYNWDPQREYTDRDLYKSLLTWLFRNRMVEWPRGNQPAKWANGWTPKLLGERMFLDAFTYDKPQAEPAVIAEQQATDGLIALPSGLQRGSVRAVK